MFRIKKINPFSFYSFVAILLYFTISFVSVEGWKEKKIMSADRANYYVYLPATFIYNDLHFSYADSLNEALGSRKVTYFVNEEGKRCQKMTAGVSIMELPFFLLAHVWASLDPKYEANGYSEIYYFFITLSALVYALLALYFLRKILLRFSSDKTTAFVLLLIAGGTNLYYYSTYIGGISHNPGLFLLACFFWFSIKYIDSKSIKALSIALFCIGMATIVRTTNILFGIFLLTYIAESSWSYKGVIQHINKNVKHYLFAFLAFFIPVIVQMSLWKYTTGDWIYYSYRDEGFFFNDPEILNGLFSGRNSLIPYAPFLILAFLGILIPTKKHFPKYSLILPLGIFIYVIYSWWCWWYGGSVGSRAAIESYIILAILLGYFIDYLWKKLPFNIVLGMLTLLATFSIYFGHLKAAQYKNVILHWDSMTYDNYWDIFLTSKRSADYNEKLQIPDYKNAKTIGEEYQGFKEMTTEEPLSEGINIELKEIEWNNRDSIRIKAFIFGGNKVKKKVVKLKISSDEGQFSKEYSIIPDKRSRQWNDAIVTIYIPENIREKSIKVAYIYSGASRCYYKLPELIITNTLPDLKN